MKITLVFDSKESAEDSWESDFLDSNEDWLFYLNSREATIEIERDESSEPIELEIPVGVIAIRI